MNGVGKVGFGRLPVGELESLREARVLLVGMGIALILLGAVAIGSSFLATYATVLVFGMLLLLGAISNSSPRTGGGAGAASSCPCWLACCISLPACS
jgi:hypothetical protein